jgi:hypothetical protein
MKVDSEYLKVLFDDIIERCRDEAEQLPRLKDGDGAIRITFLPQSELGRKLQQSVSRQASRCEVVAKIAESGNFVLNRPNEPTDSYSTTAMKVASHLRDQEIGGEDKYRDEKHGFAPSRGVLSFKLLYDHAMFALLLVSVDGGIPEENDIVVNTSREVINKWCKNGPRKGDHARLAYISN